MPTTPRHSKLGAIILLFVAVFSTGLVLTACGRSVAATQQQIKKANVTLTILDKSPDGKDGPLFDNTNLVLPAHTLVTMTIINKDPGEDPLPANSPFGVVKGTVDASGKANNTAYLSGTPYSSIPLDKASHTFTINQLGINVPIPGKPAPGQTDISVTFSFMTGDDGTYTFQCFVPCGDDPNGYGGPMAEQGFMMGTLTVKG